MFQKKIKEKRSRITRISTQRIIASFLLLPLLSISAYIYSQYAHAAITKEISYQGKLTNTSGVAVADGNYNMIISLYTVASGGTPVWTARGTVGTPATRSVAVSNGIFSIMLGDTAAGDNAINLDFNSTYYLGIKVGSDTEMTPRKKVGASGYAFNSDLLDGLDSATSGANAHIVATDASGNITASGDANVNGGDINSTTTLTLNPTGNLNFQSSSYYVNESGQMVLNTDETINGIDINAGAISDITTISSTYLNTAASYVDIVGSAELRMGGTSVLTSGRVLQNITQATIDNIIIDGTTIGHTSDTDLLNLASNILTVNGTLDLNGPIDLDVSTNDYAANFYNSNTGAAAGGLYIRTDGTGNLLTLNASGTDIVTITPTQASFNVPTSFTSSGDVSMAYDLIFTNQTAANIKTSAPFTIEVGELFESNDLTLRTFNNGDVVLDAAGGVTLMQAQPWVLATATSALNFQNSSGTSILNIDSTNGRVGVGTTSPGNNLHIANSTGAVINLQDTSATINSTAFNARVRLTDSAGALAGQMGFGSNDDLVFYNYNTAGNNIIQSGTSAYTLINPTGGNVGIGTTVPGATLHIVDAGTSAQTTLQLNNNIKFRGDGVLSWGTTANQGVLSWNTGYSMIGGQSGNDLALLSNGTEKMRILQGGNVGIGTTNPQPQSGWSGGKTLHIYDTNNLGNLRFTNAGTMDFTFAGDNANAYLQLANAGQIRILTNNLYREAIDSNGDIAMGGNITNLSTFAGASMVIRSGNVGVGTTNPSSYNLQVVGTGGFSTSVNSPIFQGQAAAATFGNASYATTIAGSGLTISPTSWTATPTISGLITATSGVTSNGTLTANGIVNLGDGGDAIAVNSNTWDISSAGAISGITTIGMSGQLTSTLATGTSPFAVTSTTVNTNLNADLLDGQHSSAFLTSFTEADTLATVTARGTVTNGQSITIGPAASYDPINISAVAMGSASYVGIITSTDLTASRTWTFPNVTGTIITTGDTGTVTNTMLAGSIANTKLANSTISGIALGSNLATLTIGTALSGTSYNGSSAVTIAVAADSIGDTQLAYNTGQNLTTANSPSFAGLYIANSTGLYLQGTAGAAGTASSGVEFYGTGVSHANIAWMPNENTFALRTGNTPLSTTDSYGAVNLSLNGNVTASRFVSTIATGTSPFAVTSTTVNTNLNADLWDGYQFASYLDQAVLTTSSPTFARVFTSGLSTGWGSTSGVNTGGMNVTMGTGASATWLLSGTSGGTFRAGIQSLDTTGRLRLYSNSSYIDINGNNVSMSGQFTSTLATGTAPFAVTSTTLNTNLNTDFLDGQHGSYYASASSISGTDNYIPRFNGTSALENSIIYDNGTNVGIGTTDTAGNKLTVAGSFFAHNGLAGVQISGTTIAPVDAPGAPSGLGLGLDIHATGNGNLLLASGGTGGNVIINGSNGQNVGIGTTTPQGKFHVDIASDANINEIGAIIGRTATTQSGSNRGIGLVFRDTVNPTLTGGVAGIRENSTGNYRGALAFFTNLNNGGNSPATTFANMTERMRIDSNGYVGIGTTSPEALLDISGGFVSGPSTGRSSSFSNTYSVPTATQVTISLRDGVAALVNGWNYRIRLVTTATSTNTGAEYIVYQTSAGAWSASLVSAYGTTSNQPLLVVSGTSVNIYHNHASTYNINTFVEGYYTGNTTLTASTFFGLDGAMTNLGGYIGIGTSSPAETLDIAGNMNIAKPSARITINGTQYSDGWIRFQQYASDKWSVGYDYSDSDKFKISSGGVIGTNDRFTITSAGNIGVGTASPGYKLDVSEGDLAIENSGWGGEWLRTFSNNTNYSYLVLQKSRGTMGVMSTTSLNDTLGDIQFRGVDTSNTSQLAAGINGAQDVAAGSNYVRGSLSFSTHDGTSYASRMYIASSGNVGIGTTIPYDKLEVAGAVSVSGGMNVVTAQGPVTSMFFSGDHGGIQAVDWGTAYKNLSLNENGGNVGIGTSNPGYPLSVGVASNDYEMVVGGSAFGLKLGYFNTSDYGAIQSHTGTGYKNLALNPSGGNVGIGTISTGAKLEVGTGALGTSLNDVVEIQRLTGTNSNGGYLDFRHIRTAAGSDWTTAGMRIQEKIDSTWMGYMQFNGNGNSGGISFGTGTTVTAPGNVGERMRIDSVGNIGIGTTVPGVRLDVQGGAVRIGASGTVGSAGDLSLSRESAPTNGYVYFGNTGSNYFGYNGSAYTFNAKTMISGSTGAINVGSGISNSTVVIAGVNAYDTAVTGYRQIGAFYSSNSLGANVGAGLTLGGIFTGTSVTDFAQIAGVKENSTDGNYSGALTMYTRLNGNAAFNERMRIDSAGNVGIGTTIPSEQLDVVGNIRTGGYISLYSSGVNAFNTTLTNSLMYNTRGDGSAYPFLEYGNLVLQSRPSGSARDIVLATGTTPAARMVVDRTGNVGIGTTSPGYKLNMYGAHTDTQFLMHSTGDMGATNTADLMLWASEPNLTYTGVGIANNAYNAISGITRINTNRGGSYIRLLDNSMNFTTITSAGASNTGMTLDGSGNLSVTGTVDGYDISTYGAYFINGAGTLGQVWTSDGAGAGVWAAAPVSMPSGTEGQMLYNNAGTWTALSTSYLFWDDVNNRMGLGTTAPGATLNIFGTTNSFRLSYDASNYSTLSTGSTGILTMASSNGTQSAVTLGAGTATDQLVLFDGNTRDFYVGQDDTDDFFKIGSGAAVGSNTYLTINGSGNVGIGVTSPTTYKFYVDWNSDGTLPAFVSNTNAWTGGGADYAEFFKTNDHDLSPGEAVCVDIQNSNAVKRCTRAEDPDLMGIVSTTPVVLGNAEPGREFDNSYVIVGMLGQVPAKVSAENGQINPGDSLTAATKPGILMKANAGDSTVGVALEPLQQGEASIQVLISRRNKSLTVEKVEEEVSQRIAEMDVQDQVNQMITQAQNKLNESITTQTTVISDLTSQLSQTNNKITTLQEQMDLIKQQNQTILDFALALDIEKLIYKDESGNLDLKTGKLITAEVVAGAFTVKVTDEGNKTIGEAKIKAITKDENNDGIDDETGSDGKSVVVKTGAVGEGSKIFVTTNIATEFPLAVTKKIEGEGFIVEMKNTVSEDITFDWWIVESEK